MRAGLPHGVPEARRAVACPGERHVRRACAVPVAR